MPKNKRQHWLWGIWLILTVAAGGYLIVALAADDNVEDSALAWGKQFFVPGATTHGHHQIELACGACHTTAFGGKEVMQDACLDCHADELDTANDTHPARLFTDPRNFEMREAVDAVYCVSCHVEHKPEITDAMGVTIATDHCLVCHRDVAETRPTHEGLAAGSCAAAGCHNYHDNRALYQEFLLKHPGEPALLENPHTRPRDFALQTAPSTPSTPGTEPQRPLTRQDQDSGGHLDASPDVLDNWATTAHANAGVNCSDCHQPADTWVAKPQPQVCGSCHEKAVDGWLSGLHGMRIKQGLSAMTPIQAQQPMKPSVANEKLSCNSCHSAHRFDVRRAAVADCVQCHNDEHTLAFRASPHFEAWQRERSGAAPPGSGVSCATCHLPRVTHGTGDAESTSVEHNQNENLRPNSKMLRGVCMDCHGLQFALDALADQRLIDNNFNGQPSPHVDSIDMAQQADREHAARRKRAAQKKNRE